MNENEKSLISLFLMGNISKKDFIEMFPVNLDENKDYILNGLKTAYTEKKSDDVEDFISLIAFDTNWKNNPEYADIFCKLIGETWHYQHENLVSLLQGLKNPNTVVCLYEAAVNKPDYMAYDDTYSLARKCIHALGDINTELAREKLELLAKSEISIIKEKAEKQLANLR